MDLRRTLLALVLGCAFASSAAAAEVTDLLMVVRNPSSLTSGESARKALLESWGYTVTLLDDHAAASSFTAAASDNAVAYVPAEVDSSALGTKLKGVSIGVVSESAALSDTYGFGPEHLQDKSEIEITNSSHYITHTWSVGAAVTVVSSSQQLLGINYGLPSGAVSLAERHRAGPHYKPALVLLEKGIAIYGGGTAAGRRALLPWGTTTFNFSALNSNGQTILARTLQWAARPMPSLGKLLLVVRDTSNLTSEEQERRWMLDLWGYDVTTIDEGATQTSFDSAVATHDVVYVSGQVSASLVGPKLKSQPIGIVSEHPALIPELGLASSYSLTSGSSLSLAALDHFLTAPLMPGPVSLFSSSASVTVVGPTRSKHLQLLGGWGLQETLPVLEVGGAWHDELGTAPGRRAVLPWNGGSVAADALTPEAKLLTRRALRWATGMVGYWKLDESSGTLATDSSTFGHHGTLDGTTFDESTVSKARVDAGLTFDGFDDRILVADTAALRLTEALTLSAWVRASSLPTGSSVASVIRKGDANSSSYQLGIRGGRAVFFLDALDTAGFAGASELDTGRWYHLAATWDGTTARLYVNGVLDTSPSLFSAPLALDTRPLWLGGTSTGDHFAGRLDELRIYDHALGEAEISGLWNQSRPLGVRVLHWQEIR